MDKLPVFGTSFNPVTMAAETQRTTGAQVVSVLVAEAVGREVGNFKK